MDFHWDASADLEDLIYENQDVSASERQSYKACERPHPRVWFFSVQNSACWIKDPSPGEVGRRGN